MSAREDVVTLLMAGIPHDADRARRHVERVAVEVRAETRAETRRVVDELRILRQVVSLVLLHDAAGEAIDCDRLRQALEGAQIDLTPDGGELP